MSSISELTPLGSVGRYDVLGRLGAGGMAEIFLARESGPSGVQRHVVVKRILPHVAQDEYMVDMFRSEAELCMNLRHPNICPIIEYGESSVGPFLAMEWVNGLSLRSLIDKAGRLPVSLALKVCADVASALHYAHTSRHSDGRSLDIVHRDVNPENIIISYDGIVKLLDFGVAKASVERKHQTEAGAVKGKFAYISPEQYQGQPLDGRNDIFALGVTLYETLTGESLYDRATEYETIAAIVLDPSVPSVRDARPDISESLDAIVAKAMSKERDLRFATADELHAALTRYAFENEQVCRDVDVIAHLRELVPNEFGAPPSIERNIQLSAGANDSFTHPEPGPPPMPSDPTEDLRLAVEADEEIERLYGNRRSGGRGVMIVSIALILASIAYVAWMISTSRATSTSADNSSTAPPSEGTPTGEAPAAP